MFLFGMYKSQKNLDGMLWIEWLLQHDTYNYFLSKYVGFFEVLILLNP